MAGRLAVLLLASAVGLCASLWAVPRASASDKPVRYEYVLLIDTSGSMSGLGPGHPHDIFPRVQSEVSRFIGSLDLGNSVVYLYPFSGGLGKASVVSLRTAADKVAAERRVGRLVANGATTAIYDSLGRVLLQLQRVRRAAPGVTHVQTILLFTDGRDTSTRTSLGQIVAQFRLARGENPYLFLKYVTLGTKADPAWSKVDGVDVSTNPPGSLPALTSVRVRPTLLDFGSLQKSSTSTRIVEIDFDKSLAGKSITLTASSSAVESAGGLVSVSPSTLRLSGAVGPSGSLVMRQALTLSVDNRASLSQTSAYAGRIALGLPNGGLVTFSPPALQFGFTLAASPQVTLVAASGSLTAPLGSLDPYQGSSTTAQATKTIRALFNNSAEQADTFVTVRLVHRTGPQSNAVQLLDANGQPTTEVKLAPGSAECSVRVTIARGQPAGAYDYALTCEPSGAQLAGIQVDGQTGVGLVPIDFKVPPAPKPPAPAWQVALKWAIWALLAVLVIAVVAFVALCVVTGTGPSVLAGLLLRKTNPKFLDARVEVASPPDAAAQFDLTDTKGMDIGPDRPGLATMPFSLRFRPRVSVMDGKDEAVVAVHPDGTGTFTLVRAATGVEEPAVSATLGSDDAIFVDDGGGGRYQLVFRSFRYTSG